jgi:hypothetical protein
MTDIIYAPLNRYFKKERTLVEWVDLMFRFYPKRKAIIRAFLDDNPKALDFTRIAMEKFKSYNGKVPDSVYKKSFMSTFEIPEDDEYFTLIIGAIYRGFGVEFDEIDNHRLIVNADGYIVYWFADPLPFDMMSFSWDW